MVWPLYMSWARPAGPSVDPPPAAGPLTTVGTTGASAIPGVVAPPALGGAAGALLSPPAPAPTASGARNSATATAFACSRLVTLWMNALGPSAICGAECSPANTCSAAAGDMGTRADGSLPVRLQLSRVPTCAGAAPGFLGSETSTRPWSTETLVV